MDLTFAKTFLQQKANELGFEGQVAIKQPDYVGPVLFVAEYPDGSFVDLGRSVQDAEATIRRLVGATSVKPVTIRPAPVETAAPVAAKAKAKR